MWSDSSRLSEYFIPLKSFTHSSNITDVSCLVIYLYYILEKCIFYINTDLKKLICECNYRENCLYFIINILHIVMQISDFINANANDLQFGKKFVFRWTKRTHRILHLWEIQCQWNERLIFSEREKSHFLFLSTWEQSYPLTSSASLSQDGDAIWITCFEVRKQYRKVAALCYPSGMKHQFSGINYKFKENRIS